MNKKKGLTVGDAVTIVALLLFVFAWIGLFGAVADSAVDDHTHITAFGGMLVILGLFGPPLWAADLIGRIVRRGA